MSREDNLIRSAKLRALILSALNSDIPGMTMKVEDLHQVLQAKMFELGYTRMNLYAMLATMTDQGLIIRVSTGNYKVNINHQAEEVTETKKRKSKKASLSTLPPEVSIEIVKSTGKVRLSIKGLVIEIGVSDD